MKWTLFGAIMTFALTTLVLTGCHGHMGSGHGSHITGGQHVVNQHCPVMGTKIDSMNMAPEYTRDFHGQKVGFCCKRCLKKWDSLSDAEKEAKLKTAMDKNLTHAQKKAMGNM